MLFRSENRNSSGAQATAALLGSDATSMVANLRLHASTSYSAYPVLRMEGPGGNTNYDINLGGSSSIGTVSQTTNARVQIGPNFPLSDFLVLSNSFIGEVVTGSGSGAFSTIANRSEERRVGKECRSRWSPYH